MQCIKCGHTLDKKTSGFVVCPECSTVNIPPSINSTPVLNNIDNSINTSTYPSSALSMNNGTPNILPHKPIIDKFVIFALTATTILIFVVGMFIYLWQQNNTAKALYVKAKTDIAKGQYKEAASLLDKANRYNSFSSTHKLIKQLQSQDKIWITDDVYLQNAETLVSKKNFMGATSNINKIDKTFPRYGSVVTLKNLIAKDQKDIADAQKAASLAALSKAAAEKVTATIPVHITYKPTPKSGTNNAPSSYGSYTLPVYNKYGYNYYYAGSGAYATASGASVNIKQEKPLVTQTAGSSNHSLMELAVLGPDGDTVEVGWSVGQTQFGDDLPHLFVYHFASGQTTCYNGCGFVQVSGTNTAGEVVNVGATANYKVNYANGQWDIYYNSDELGYFPASAFSNSFTQTLSVKIYGEVATTGNTCIQMGNGIAGSDPSSASFSNLNFIAASYLSPITTYNTSSSPYNYGYVSSTGLNIGGSGTC